MKRSYLLVILTFFIFIILNSMTYLYSQDLSQLRPTQPPRIPVTDYDTGPHRIMDFLYMHYNFDEFTLDGGGLGFNYVNNLDKLGYNLGIGGMYMQGASTDLNPELNVYVWNLPINGNLGIRLIGNPDTSSLMIFGGLQWSYMWLYATYGDHDVYAYGPAYGPIAGAKAEIKLTPSVSLIPYYIFQQTMFDLTIEVDGYAQNVDIDPVTSHLIGFDIKIAEFSVGALLDALNNTDNDKITILFSYDFDYKTGSEDLNRSDEKQGTPVKANKPAKKQQTNLK